MDLETTIPNTEPEGSSALLTIAVEGMTCAACALRIERKLSKMDGVKSAGVNYATHEALVAFDSDRSSVELLVSKIEETGYDVRKSVAESRLEGPSAQREAKALKSELLSLPGVLQVGLDSKGEQVDVHVRYVSTVASGEILSQIFSRYHSAENEPVQDDSGAAENQKRLRRVKKRMIVALALSLPLAVLAMSHGLIQFQGEHIIQLLLATPVVLYSGSPFFASAFKAMRHRASDMNTLVALGVGAAYGYSILAVIAPDLVSGEGQMPDVYFEASALIVTFILLGRLLEERAKGKTGAAVDSLRKLQPDTAQVETNGAVVTVATETVSIGEKVRILPGERIPVDGYVLEGNSRVDESMLTGESLEIAKREGDGVSAGTINAAGVLLVEVSRSFRDTMLSQIARMVKQAQVSKAPIQHLADRVASVFVPIVLLIACITALSWWVFGPEPVMSNVLLRSVAVLIIACPCALGLATPTAIVVGTGLAATDGILIKDAAAIQRIGTIKVVALDKTGTITLGKPEVKRVEPTAGYSEDVVLGHAAAVEKHSEHPLARAVVRESEKRGLKLAAASAHEVVPGKGISAQVEGVTVRVGNARFMNESGITTGEQQTSQSTDPQFLVAFDGKIIGLITVGDVVREEVADALSTLRKSGIRTVMLTGDRKEVAEHVAQVVGIDEVQSDLLPEDKMDAIRELQSAYGSVAMIGDGINDAPALAIADVGIAIRSGTDIAYEASDITLLTNDLRLVNRAVSISVGTMRTIRQNLFFAFLYNVVCIPLAAGALFASFGVLLSPVIASAAMALSSVSVVSNSLRLKTSFQKKSRS